MRDDLLSLEDADTKEEGEKELVLLKQRAADIAVDAAGEVFVQMGDPLTKVV